jgi:isopenicillin N synthase-like dioxygenase
MSADTSVWETGIPAIDIRSSNPLASQQLLDATIKYGFVFIENNAAGVAPDEIGKMFELSRQFFALPQQTKQEYSIRSKEAANNHGWISERAESLDPTRQKRLGVKEFDCLIAC